MPSIIELAQLAIESVEQVAARHKKKASFRLYNALALTLEVIERCLLDPAEEKELMAALKERAMLEGKTVLIHPRNDTYGNVCRYVFYGTDSTNAARYAACLREAAKLQIRSNNLAAYLATHGGERQSRLVALSHSGRTARIDPLQFGRYQSRPIGGKVNFTKHIGWTTMSHETEVNVELIDRICDRVEERMGTSPEALYLLQSMTGILLLRYSLAVAKANSDKVAQDMLRKGPDLALMLQAQVVARLTANNLRGTNAKSPLDAAREASLDLVTLLEAGRFPDVANVHELVAPILAVSFPDSDTATEELLKRVKPNKNAS